MDIYFAQAECQKLASEKLNLDAVYKHETKFVDTHLDSSRKTIEHITQDENDQEMEIRAALVRQKLL